MEFNFDSSHAQADEKRFFQIKKKENFPEREQKIKVGADIIKFHSSISTSKSTERLKFDVKWK